MVIPRLEITGSSKLDIPTEATVSNYVKILFVLAIILFLVDYFVSSGIISLAGMMLMSLSFIYLIFFCALFVAYDDGNLTVGHISSNTDSEYKIGHLVSIPVKMGGLDTGLSVTLSSEKPGALKEISSLNLNSSDSENQINDTLKSNGYLTGKAIDAGKYKVDINTTSLDPGYYNLRLENVKYKQISSVNTFYLSGQ